jgi:hypothetical protein
MHRQMNVKRLSTVMSVMLASSVIALTAVAPASAAVPPAGTTARPAVEDCGTGAALTRPGSLILTCADSGMVASHLHWESWTSTKATATATVIWRTNATKHDQTTADVTLSDPVRETGKTVLFTKLRLRVTGATPRGFLRDVTFNEAPAPALPPSAASPVNGPVAGPTSRSPITPAAASGTLNTAAIGGYWELAGGGSSVAETAEAITGAESSFEPGAIQAGQPYSTTGWGLWQITPGDSVPTYGEDYQLLDPWNNAEAAIYKYINAGGFFPWTTYDDGAYEKYLGDTATPNTSLSDPGQYDPTASGPSGVHNSSEPGSTYGPTIPGSSTTPPPTFAFKAVFQDNDNDLAGYSNSTASFTTTLGMKAGTSPSVCTLSDGTFEAAFEANNDTLAFSHLGGGTLNTTMGMLAGTSPSISALPNGGWVSAFQDNDDVLVVYTSSGSQIITNLGMDPGTNPAIAVAPNGSYKVVFQDNDNVLAGYNSSGSNFTTTAGMKPGTSPALAAEPDGTYEAAAEANTDDLVTFHLGTGISVNTTTLGMDAGTNPAVATQTDNSFKVVFQDNDNVLAGYNSDGGNFTTTVGMKAGTSPSINREPNGEWEAAVEDNDDDLATIHLGSGISVNTTTLGMDNATSPSITY